MSQSRALHSQDDPVLVRFRSALDAIFGDRIERLVLFGSRARGDAQPDSDYDVAVFLNDFSDRRQEVRRMIPLVTDIIEETGVVIHPMPYRAGAWRERTPLMHELRRDGIDL
jgi:predicted nucleotidyltransferase